MDIAAQFAPINLRAALMTFTDVLSEPALASAVKLLDGVPLTDVDVENVRGVAEHLRHIVAAGGISTHDEDTARAGAEGVDFLLSAN